MFIAIEPKVPNEDFEDALERIRNILKKYDNDMIGVKRTLDGVGFIAYLGSRRLSFLIRLRVPLRK